MNAKQLNIVNNSEAGRKLTEQERVNYMNNSDFSSNYTTLEMLNVFRKEVSSHLLGDNEVSTPFNFVT